MMMQPQQLNRFERKKQATRNRIRECAVQVFLEKGYSNTTVQDIMERADLGYGTFYKHYKNRQDVLVELTSEVLEQITVNYTKPPKTEQDIYRRTLHSIRNVMRSCYLYREIFLVLQSVRSNDEELRQLRDSIYGELFIRLRNDISWSMEKGLCRDVRLATALAALEGMIHGVINYIIENSGLTIEDIDQIAEDTALLFKEAIFTTSVMPEKK
ncbi:TetR/AcrR family transcriptional regulator [Aneurinibacillus sp. Ricciae_BoGa-3]|uniref:TetR/AcrR family transcriptional regulator n=1 Tax=Aneurinibacillus sp. Ricciae_BoGa-3 TaxID=3022697 RepID=UPI002340EC96|nr:TetR/AcrR family transcriptional regulator [Aneurinibacillus sp. Ricciae_BoGa-3]WCK54405.1 TetR/AcrR family transcriptional regulator [Aneurinibacillus sp. Ricciae_BoGa-3]